MLTTILLATVLVAQEAPKQVVKTTNAPGSLVQIKADIDAARLLEKDGVITPTESKPMQDALLEKASSIEGKPLTYETLELLTRGLGERLKDFFTFTNTILIIAAFLGVIAVIALCGHYLVSILAAIPAGVYELLMYALCGGLLYLGTRLSPGNAAFAVLPGSLGLVGCFALTDHLHDIKLKAESWSLLLSIIWGGIAFYFQSQAIGFISIMALLGAIGMSDVLDPFYHLFGYADDHVIKTTTGSFAILSAYVVSHITGQHIGRLSAFNVGAEWMGTFGYFIGLMYLASKNYSRKPGIFWSMQLISIVSGIGALYLGNMFNMHYLRGVGGTFFCFYLIEKYCELPWRGIGWAWAALGLAGILYGFVIFAQSHPQYFLFMG